MNPLLILLSQCSRKRFVSRCQNGIIQLAWDEVKIHLRPANFARLVRLLEKGVVELEMQEAHEGRSCCLKQTRLGAFHLQLGHVGLDLTLLDFLALAEITRLATRQLTSNHLSGEF